MIYFFSCFLNFFIFHCFLSSLLNLKFSKKITFILFSVFFILMTLTMFLNNHHLNMLVGTIIRFPYVFILFSYNFSTAIILVCFFVIQNACVEIIVANLLQLAFRSNLIDHNDILFLMGIILSSICSFLICFIFSKLYKANYIRKLPKYAYSVFILPTTTILLLININNYVTIFQQNKGLLFILIGLVLSNFVIFFIFNKIILFVQADERQKQEKQLIITKYKITQQLVDIQNKTLHDIREQSNEMLSLLENKKYDDLLHYLHKNFLSTIKLYSGANSNCIELNKSLQVHLDELNERHFELQITLKTTRFPISSEKLSFLFNEVIVMIIKYASEDCQRKTLAIKSNFVGKNQIGLSFSFPYLSKDFVVDKVSNINVLCNKNKIMVHIENINVSNVVIIFFLFTMES